MLRTLKNELPPQMTEAKQRWPVVRKINLMNFAEQLNLLNCHVSLLNT